MTEVCAAFLRPHCLPHNHTPLTSAAAVCSHYFITVSFNRVTHLQEANLVTSAFSKPRALSLLYNVSL